VTGKSTTINVLTGVTSPTSGTVVFDGADITGLASHRIAVSGMVRTFQNGRLFGRLTVLENVQAGYEGRMSASLLGSALRTPWFRDEERKCREEALARLADVGLADERDRLVSELPYGKQRKLELARALMLRPRLLLLDEPAAGLNSGEVTDLVDHLQRLRNEGLTILVVEHNMSLVMRAADRIAVLNFGCKIAEGPPEEIRTSEVVIEAYLGRNSRYAKL